MAVCGQLPSLVRALALGSFIALVSAQIAIVRPILEWEKDPLISYAVSDILTQHKVPVVHLEDIPIALSEQNLGGIIILQKCSTSAEGFNTFRNHLTLPSLTLTIGKCEIPTKFAENVVPLFIADDHRKYSCLSYVIRMWLRENISISSSLNKTNIQINPPKMTQYTTHFLECVGFQFYTPQIRTQMTKEKGRAYLNGRKILIATINRPPFLIFTFGGQDGNEILTWKGYCIDMLNYLAAKFNFSYKLILPPDGNWGAPTPNGTFNGMVGMVQRHEVEFAMASLTITYIREQVIDFPHRFYEDPTTILIPPPIEIKNTFAFLSPYQPMIWLYMVIGIFCVAFIMWILTLISKRFSGFLYPYKDPRYLHSGKTQFSRYLFQTSFVLVAQGTRLRQTNSSRILLGFWWISGFILYFSYTSTLISFLTVPRMENLIDSLEELSQQKAILWTYRANTAYENLFGEAEPPSTYYKIGLLLKEKPELKVKSDEEGVRAVLYKRMAYIKEKSWLDFAMERDYLDSGKCRLSQVPQEFFSAGFGWALQEGSLYLELFNDIFLRMRQNGLFEYWKKRYWPKPNKCSTKRGSTPIGPRAISLEDFTGHFFILGFGSFLGILVFIVECILHKMFKLGSKDM